MTWENFDQQTCIYANWDIGKHPEICTMLPFFFKGVQFFYNYEFHLWISFLCTKSRTVKSGKRRLLAFGVLVQYRLLSSIFVKLLETNIDE